jgi:hypothetical protein
MNIKILNWPEPPWKREKGGVKRTGKDEAIGILTCICMETTQGYSLSRYLYLKLAKIHVFLFSFYLFFFYKIEPKGNTGSAGVGGGTDELGRGGREREMRINTLQIMHTHVCKCKNVTKDLKLPKQF